MVWRKLVSGLIGRSAPSAAEAFLDELIAVEHTFAPARDPEDPTQWLSPVTKPIWELLGALRRGDPPPPPALRWWEELHAGLRATYPQADVLALHWLLDYAGRQERVARAAERLEIQYYHYLDPIAVLMYWVQQHPASGAADAVTAALRGHLQRLSRPPARAHPYELWAENAVNGLVDVLAALEGAEEGRPYARGRALTLEAVGTERAHRLAAAAAPGGATMSLTAHGGSQLTWRIVTAFFPLLLRADRLSEDELAEVLTEKHLLLINEAVRRMEASAAGRRKLAAVIDRFLARVAAGEQDPAMWRVLGCYGSYAGIDHFLAGTRYLEGYLATNPKQKLPIDHQVYSSSAHPLSWAAFLLRGLAAPAAADRERAGELQTLKPATLLAAALYSPAWAELVEDRLGWPDLGALVRWLRRYGGPGPWSAYRAPAAGEDEEDPGVVDRAAALAAVAAMGEQRVRQIIKHQVARGLYADGLYALQALLGWSAAEIEAGFLKRNKRAVRALGMLPDEGDILDRYLALRRFAEEAKQFGAQRQASERLAAESGLANLARTAGYDDLSQLEWAMEAEIGREVDPERTWTVGDYTVRLEPSPAATVLVSRGGKALKSVPAAVRGDAAYAEIKAAREQLAGQFSRVRRRLELMMAQGEVMARRDFAPALTTPAGRALLPGLVLRLWPAGAAEPIEALAGRTLAGEVIALDAVEGFAIAHPLHLRQSGSLSAWQRRLVEEDRVQPFNQLFREVYTAIGGEREAWDTGRLAGRRVRLGVFKERLKRHGWRGSGEGELARPCWGGLEASLWFSDGAAYSPAEEVLTIERLHFYGPGFGGVDRLEPLLFSEVMREVDRASAAAAPDRAAAPVSDETLAARAGLVRALVAAATAGGELVAIGGHSLHLGSGAVLGPDGAAVALPALPAPAIFPYSEPETEVVEIAARALYLAGLEERKR